MALFDPYDPKQLNGLMLAVGNDRDNLEGFQQSRYDLIVQLGGSGYENRGYRGSQQVQKKRVPINWIEIAMTIYLTHLASQNPQVIARTRIPQLKPISKGLELDVNERLREIDFADELQMCVMDALLQVGLMRVGIDSATLDSYSTTVDLDDAVWDTTSKRWNECLYVGNRWRMDYDEALENPAFYKKARERLTPLTTISYNETGFERVEELSRSGRRYQFDQFKQYVELYDIYIRELDSFITVPSPEHFHAHGYYGSPLRVFPFDGMEDASGPGGYYLLTYHRMPNNIMPISPLGLRRDLHDLANNLFRKVDRQARRAKTVTGYRKAAKKDASRIQAAKDGAMIAMQDPDGVKDFTYGGPDRSLMSLLAYVNQLFSHDSGNLEVLGGLSSMGGTLGQEELLVGSSSKRMNFMQQRTIAFARKVIQALAWNDWTNPVRTRILSRRIPNTDLFDEMIWSPETRGGDFIQHDLDLVPYSMNYQSPSQQAQMLIQIFTQLLVPGSQQLAMQGRVPDFGRLIDELAHLYNLPQLRDMLMSIAPDDRENVLTQMRHSSEPRQAAHTVRENVRKNVPASSRNAQDALIAGGMFGGGVQPSEGAALARPASAYGGGGYAA